MAGENDHRRMNSLQFVASLLNLQARAVHSTEAAGQLSAAANRVSAVARVHRTFAAEPNAERLPILAYLRRLCGELAAILETSIAIDGIDANIPTDQVAEFESRLTVGKAISRSSIAAVFIENALPD